MDYEKAYKEALERAKLSRQQLLDIGEEATEIEHIFPELAESEDEKIRKAVITYIKYNVSDISGWSKKELIAWLEKQGEQKFEWIENDDEDLSSIANKFIPEPVWNALEESEGEGSNVSAYDYSQMIDMFKSGVQWFKSVKQNPLKIAKFKKGEQNHTWSEEDEMMLTSTINTLKLLEDKGATNMKIAWLNALKQKSHWKPSEEQMNALNMVYKDKTIQTETLKSLYNDLKKL